MQHCLAQKFVQERTAIIAKFLGVRQLAMNFRGIARRHLDLFSQPAHALRLLRPQQVPSSGMMPHHFAGRCHLKALRGSAMRLQLHFFSWLPRHSTPRVFNKLFLLSPAINFGSACQLAAAAGAGRAAALFLGASKASRMFASMRGPNSTSACSSISFSRRVIFARPTS